MKIATILLKRDEQEDIKNKVNKIIENYDNFVLVEVTDEQAQSLRGEGFKVVIKNEIENIKIGTATIKTTQPRYNERGIWSHPSYDAITDPGKGMHHYILQFIGPIKDEWKNNIQELGGIICDPLPSYSYIVEMDEKSRAKIIGLPFVRWVGHYDSLFRISSGLLKEMEERKMVGIETSALEKKMEPLTKVKSPSKISGSIPDKFSITFHTKENLKAAIPEIKKLGGEIISESGNSITANIAQEDITETQEDITEKIKEMANIHGVKLIDTVKIRQVRNNVATKIMCGSEPSLSLDLPLTGKGEIIGVADTGIDTGDINKIHEDFKGRISGIRSWPIQPEFNDIVQNQGDDDGPADEYEGHGTHVTGSVLGNGKMSVDYVEGSIRGLAIESKLYFQAVEQLMNYTNNYVKSFRRRYGENPETHILAGLPSDLKILFKQSYDANVRIHTNSWGSSGEENFGIYDSQSEDVDRFVWENKDMVILFAAGNDGNDKNGDGKVDPTSVTPPGTAKNCICVGASENIRTNGGYNPGGDCETYGGCWPNFFPSNPIKDDRISDNINDIVAFSSRGPCIDKRFKPDIVAPGTNILSTRSKLAKDDGWGLLPSDNPMRSFYMFMGGTSMATPLTAGAVALIRQYLRKLGLNPSASLVKASLINAAVRLPYRYAEDVHTSVLWDFEQGWGHVNLQPFISNNDGFRMEFIDGEGLKTGELKEYFFEVQNSNPFKATLVYTDYPASPENYPSIINNLNLVVTTPEGKDFHGNQFLPPYDSIFDTNNNVETVYINNPTTGKYKVTVLASDISEGPQDFSIVISGGLEKVVADQDKGTITGWVFNKSTNKPLENVKIIADTGQNTNTNSNGKYELGDVPVGDRIITVNKTGCKEVNTSVTVNKNTIVTATTFELDCTQINIKGSIKDRSKKPIDSVNVFTNRGERTLTKSDGTYELSGIPAGNIAVSAYKAGYKCSCAVVIVKEDEETILDLYLEK